jgi:WhiB family redox-sensing transcriptional regulator
MSAAEAWQPIDVAGDPHEAVYRGDPATLVDAMAELLGALQRPAWHARAACRGQGPRQWYPGRGDSTTSARDICARCPVQSECLDDAQDRADMHGVWAGLSVRQRQNLRKGRPVQLSDRRPVPVAALAAFVDAAPGMTWPARLERWNLEHPERPFVTATALAEAWRYRRA